MYHWSNTSFEFQRIYCDHTENIESLIQCNTLQFDKSLLLKLLRKLIQKGL